MANEKDFSFRRAVAVSLRRKFLEAMQASIRGDLQSAKAGSFRPG
jgi:hypothetical protein